MTARKLGALASAAASVFLLGACGSNMFESLANKSSAEAKRIDAQMAIDKGDYGAALTSLQTTCPNNNCGADGAAAQQLAATYMGQASLDTFKLIEVADSANTYSTGTGTVSCNGTTAVTGAGTVFSTQLQKNGTVKIGATTYTIASIASNTSLTLKSTCATTGGATFTYNNTSATEIITTAVPTVSTANLTNIGNAVATLQNISSPTQDQKLQLGIAQATAALLAVGTQTSGGSTPGFNADTGTPNFCGATCTAGTVNTVLATTPSLPNASAGTTVAAYVADNLNGAVANMTAALGTAGTGTVTCNGTTTVTGTGTAFSATLSANDKIIIGSQTLVITAAGGATSLTTATACATASGVGYSYTKSTSNTTAQGITDLAATIASGGCTKPSNPTNFTVDAAAIQNFVAACM